MSSDHAYSSFLDQANQDTGASKASVTSDSATTKSVNTEIPPHLQSVEQFYTSDTDEPFEAVSLKYNGKSLPSENEFKDLINHNSKVSILNSAEFDPHGQYKDIFAVVDRAGDGKFRIYRVEHGKTRAEYYILSLDEKGKRVVGVKAKAVES